MQSSDSKMSMVRSDPAPSGRPMRRLAWLAAAVLSLPLAALHDASAQLLIKPDNQWRYSLGAGGSISSGNSSSRNLNINIDALKATAHDKLTAHGRLLYGRTDGETAANQVSTGFLYDRYLSEDWFAFVSLDWLRDRPSNLSNRWSTNTGLGYHVYKEERGFWDVFGGVGYTRDELIAPSVVSDRLRTTYGRAELILGEDSQYRLTESTTLKQRLTLFPNLDDGSNFRGVFATSLAVAMNNRYSLTASLSYRYTSDPGAGLKKADMQFVTGISVKVE